MSLMAEKVERVVALRNMGLKYREIAERLGISTSYAQQLAKDPKGEQTRARKMKRRCVDCGTAIYSDDPAKGPQLRCSPCSHRHQSENAKWTRETIIAAIRHWADLYGEPPSAGAWNAGLARAVDLERFRAGDYPALNSVQQRFGRFGEAVREAGFQSKSSLAGKPRNRVSKETYRAMAQMQESGAAISEIAAHFGINKAAASMRLRTWKGRNISMAAPNRAESVLEREIKRFEDRANQAEAKAEEAREQARRLNLALAALKNGQPS